MGGDVVRGRARFATGLTAAVAAVVTVVLLCFVGTQVWLEGDFAIYAAQHVGDQPYGASSPIGWAQVAGSVALAAFGAPAMGALAYLAGVLVRVAAAGPAPAVTGARHTYVAAAVVGAWTLLFAAFGWRP